MSLELPLLIGPRHTLGAFVLMRGETLLETIEPGMAAVFCLLSGGASIRGPAPARDRQPAHPCPTRSTRRSQRSRGLLHHR
ncbi:MAG: hypothetical protein IPK80_20960 [Nannocystis sp.]|nr:hypothetical protein [Nannocystis sp.]